MSKQSEIARTTDEYAELRERAESWLHTNRHIIGEARPIRDLLSALTATEQRLREARLHVWQGWHEMNIIRARDGIPYTYSGRPSDVDETYWSDTVDAMSDFLGDDAKPWPPKSSLSAQQSATREGE